ncbi:GlsB/YeaQ/YmgE family stress response membrane protein [Trinickia sp. YCB016]
MEGLISWIVIGAIAGWLAGLLVKDQGLGLIIDIVVGVMGALIGGCLSDLLGISLGSGLIGSLITAMIGAVILLFITHPIKRA